MVKIWFLLWFVITAFNYHPALAHESCCKHKLKQQQAGEFVDDPRDIHPPSTFWTKFSGEVQSAIPWVTLGVLITGLATCCLALPPYRYLFDRWKNSFQNSVLMAALLGLATPLCSCGALPVALSFWNAGIPPSSVVAFLTASQSAGIDSAAITYGLLGPVAVFSRLIGALIMAMAAGYCLPSSSGRPSSITMQKTTSNVPKSSPLTTQSTENNLRLLVGTVVDTAVEVFPSTSMS